MNKRRFFYVVLATTMGISSLVFGQDKLVNDFASLQVQFESFEKKLKELTKASAEQREEDLVVLSAQDISEKSSQEKVEAPQEKKEQISNQSKVEERAPYKLDYQHTPKVSVAIIYHNSGSFLSPLTKDVIFISTLCLFSSQCVPILMNGKLAKTFFNFLKQPNSDQDIPIVLQCKSLLNDNEYKLYALYEPLPFVLLIPKDYLKEHPETGFDFQNLVSLSIREIDDVFLSKLDPQKAQESAEVEEAKKMQNIEEKEGAEKVTNDKKTQTAKNVARAILRFFKKFDSERPLLWNVLLFGHGLTSTKGGFSPVNLLLAESGASFAGIEAQQFIKLLEGLMLKVVPNIIIWETCFGGGVNAQAVEGVVALIKGLHKQLKKEFTPGILVSVATGDFQIGFVRNKISRLYSKFFTYLAEVNVDDLEEKIKEKIQKAIRALGLTSSTASGLILMPKKDTFENLKITEGVHVVVNGPSTFYHINDPLVNETLEVKPTTEYFRIRLLLPGDFTEQTITEIKTNSFDFFMNVFHSNKSPFFKILNIKKLEERERQEPWDFFEAIEDETSYDVKIILFPKKLDCEGYVVYSTSDQYPRKIIVKKGAISSEVYSLEAQNKEQFDELMRNTFNQIMANGLFEREFVAENEKMVNAALAEGPSSRAKSSDFSELLKNYKVPFDMKPDADGFENVLMDIAFNMEWKDKPYTFLEKIANRSRSKIIGEIKSLNKEKLKTLEEYCKDSNIIMIPVALAKLPSISADILEQISINFEKRNLSFYQDDLIKLLEGMKENHLEIPSGFLKKLDEVAINGSNDQIKDFLQKNYPEIKS